jgi:hypothetical protein
MRTCKKAEDELRVTNLPFYRHALTAAFHDISFFYIYIARVHLNISFSQFLTLSLLPTALVQIRIYVALLMDSPYRIKL